MAQSPVAPPRAFSSPAHRQGHTWGAFGLSPGAPAAPIRQKARFKIRDAKCHLQPRSHEPSQDAQRQLLPGERPVPPEGRSVPATAQLGGILSVGVLGRRLGNDPESRSLSQPASQQQRMSRSDPSTPCEI